MMAAPLAMPPLPPEPEAPLPSVPLPPLPPAVLHLGWRNHVRLGRDYYVRVDTNDYSVDPSAIGARVDVAADLDTIRVRHGGRVVAEHAGDPNRSKTGPIGLQLHDQLSIVQFRNVRIKEVGK